MYFIISGLDPFDIAPHRGAHVDVVTLRQPTRLQASGAQARSLGNYASAGDFIQNWSGTAGEQAVHARPMMYTNDDDCDGGDPERHVK